MRTDTRTLAGAMDVLADRNDCGGPDINAKIAEAADRLRELDARVQELEEEVAEHLAMIVSSEGYYCREGLHMSGWYDSQAMRDVVYAGDRLVAMGRWERHPNGVGRRQFYRPLHSLAPANPPAKECGDE